MWRWMRWVLGGMLVVVAFFAVEILRVNYKAREAEREQAVRYGTMLENVRKEYPVGISAVDVMAHLKQEYVGYSEMGRELLIPLGSDPSYVWYCSNWITYADLEFDGDVFHESPVLKLQRINKRVIGGTCL